MYLFHKSYLSSTYGYLTCADMNDEHTSGSGLKKALSAFLIYRQS